MTLPQIAAVEHQGLSRACLAILLRSRGQNFSRRRGICPGYLREDGIPALVEPIKEGEVRIP
jgi:hypothetical protein